jgi:hypothetical protein
MQTKNGINFSTFVSLARSQSLRDVHLKNSMHFKFKADCHVEHIMFFRWIKILLSSININITVIININIIIICVFIIIIIISNEIFLLQILFCLAKKAREIVLLIIYFHLVAILQHCS